MVNNNTDYEAVLKEIEGLMSASAGSPEGERLDQLVREVENYEGKFSLPADRRGEAMGGELK
jgi:hypothetical protein